MNRYGWLIVGALLALGGAAAALWGSGQLPAARSQAIEAGTGPTAPAASSVDTPSAQEETGWPSAGVGPSDRTIRLPAATQNRRGRPRGTRPDVVNPAKRARARSSEASAPAPPAANLPGRADGASPAARSDGSAALEMAPAAPSAAPPSAPANPPHAPSPSMSPPAPPILTAPVPISLEPPRHPLAWRVVVETPGLVAEARPEHVTARVRLRLLVRVDGTVGAVEVATTSGRSDLDAAAAAAARTWRFAPGRRDGEPMESRVLIWVAFVLEP